MKRKIILLALIGVIGGSILTGCSVASKDTLNTAQNKQEKIELNVFVAASLKNAITDITDNYNKLHPDITFVINADSTGKLQKQVEEGAVCDIFFSAAMTQVDNLDEGGYVAPGTTTKLLQNKVVIIKAKDSKSKVTGFEDISNARDLALAGESVPVGDYARQIFKNLGNLDEVMKMDINEVTKVTEALMAVSEGSNEVGIVYKTDAVSMKDSVEIIAEAPKDALDKPVVYPIARIKDSEEDENIDKCADEFFDYIKSEEGLKVLEDYGFEKYEEN